MCFVSGLRHKQLDRNQDAGNLFNSLPPTSRPHKPHVLALHILLSRDIQQFPDLRAAGVDLSFPSFPTLVTVLDRNISGERFEPTTRNSNEPPQKKQKFNTVANPTLFLIYLFVCLLRQSGGKGLSAATCDLLSSPRAPTGCVLWRVNPDRSIALADWLDAVDS